MHFAVVVVRVVAVAVVVLWPSSYSRNTFNNNSNKKNKKKTKKTKATPPTLPEDVSQHEQANHIDETREDGDDSSRQPLARGRQINGFSTRVSFFLCVSLLLSSGTGVCIGRLGTSADQQQQQQQQQQQKSADTARGRSSRQYGGCWPMNRCIKSTQDSKIDGKEKMKKRRRLRRRRRR